MVYLIAAFSWWTILLLQKNNEVYELKTELMSQLEGPISEELHADFKKAQIMIIGEGLVFALSILVSLILINRAFWTEIKANKKLNNFLLSVTHELKTPIASVKLITDTLLGKKLEEAQQKELLSASKDETSRLESLVNNILTVTQMEADYHYNFEAVDLVSVAKSRVMRFQKLHDKFSIEESYSEDNITINADHESIIKLIDNLIDNAIKYSGEGDRMKVEIKQSNGLITLSVADFGIGINEKDRKKIFEKFYRIGDENMRSSKGTGLGLFIVSEICKAHKARLILENNKPQGSIFKVIFKSDRV